MFPGRLLDSWFEGTGRGGPVAEKPLRDEFLSIERLEERARALAARFVVDPSSGRGARSALRRFDDNAVAVRATYRALEDDVHQGAFVTPAGEWLLDDYHLVASEIRQVRQNLPRGYYRELPKLAARGRHLGRTDPSCRREAPNSGRMPEPRA